VHIRTTTSPARARARGDKSPRDYKAPKRIDGPARIGIKCNMTGGSSSGGWIAGFDPSVGGWIVGVNSTGDDRSIYSPYLGDAALDLSRFSKIRRRASRGFRRSDRLRS
jgi:hypothetical protein